MCGISGFIDFNRRSSEDILSKISDTLTHRGPDGSGIIYFDTTPYHVGLAHRRLSIIDLSERGRQPMTYGHLHITFNGEIYNFSNVKKELIELGHVFLSDGDTEVVLQAYARWGISCVERFIGMFAFVIYDTQRKELICVRDRAGVKPFYYYWNEGLFLFASELKAFHQHPEFKKQINHNAVRAFMQFGNVPAPHCIFKNCFKLQAGHYLRMDLEHKKFTEEKYWTVYEYYNKPKLDVSFMEAKKEVTEVLKSAFQYRMVSDVPVGVFLSGGYDSTCLTAILQAQTSKKLKTFTIGVEDNSLDEAKYAKETSQYLGTEHTEVYCNMSQALELIPQLPFFYDEPFGDQSAIPTMLVSKLAKQEVTVALSADGGDEVFAGYNRYDYLMRQGKLLNRTPSFIRNTSAGIMNRIPADKIPVLKRKYNFHNRYEKLKRLLRDPSPENFMFSLSKQFEESEITALLKENTTELKTNYNNKELKQEYYTPLSYMMAIDYQTYLADDILQKVDRASMAFSLEGREPFLDHRIIELAARLPDNFKYNEGVKKYIVREIVHDYIPATMMNRPKMGFAVPMESWLFNELRPLVDEYLGEESIKATGIFNEPQVRQLVNAFYSGKKEYMQKIWYLLSFQMWYKKWMH